MNLEIILFYLFASMTLTSGVLVIGSKNPIHSILFLVLVFFNASGLLLLLKAEFLAMIFLVVYVGAIAVLFLFVVMMLNIKLTELTENTLQYFPIGGIVGLIFLMEVSLIVDNDLTPSLFSSSILPDSPVIWSTDISETTNMETIGLLIYTTYFYYFLIASLVLLVAMIGAIVLTISKRAGVQKQDIFEQVSRCHKNTIYLKT